MHSDLKFLRKAIRMVERIESVLFSRGVRGRGEDDGNLLDLNFGTVYGDPNGMCLTVRMIVETDQEGVELTGDEEHDEVEEIMRDQPARADIICALAFDEFSCVGVTYMPSIRKWYGFLGQYDAARALAPAAVDFARKIGIEKATVGEDAPEEITKDRALEIINAIGTRFAEHQATTEAAMTHGVSENDAQQPRLMN